jgi:hypothetical protein
MPLIACVAVTILFLCVGASSLPHEKGSSKAANAFFSSKVKRVANGGESTQQDMMFRATYQGWNVKEERGTISFGIDLSKKEAKKQPQVKVPNWSALQDKKSPLFKAGYQHWKATSEGLRFAKMDKKSRNADVIDCKNAKFDTNNNKLSIKFQCHKPSLGEMNRFGDEDGKILGSWLGARAGKSKTEPVVPINVGSSMDGLPNWSYTPNGPYNYMTYANGGAYGCNQYQVTSSRCASAVGPMAYTQNYVGNVAGISPMTPSMMA